MYNMKALLPQFTMSHSLCQFDQNLLDQVAASQTVTIAAVVLVEAGAAASVEAGEADMMGKCFSKLNTHATYSSAKSRKVSISYGVLSKCSISWFEQCPPSLRVCTLSSVSVCRRVGDDNKMCWNYDVALCRSSILAFRCEPTKGVYVSLLYLSVWPVLMKVKRLLPQTWHSMTFLWRQGGGITLFTYLVFAWS